MGNEYSVSHVSGNWNNNGWLIHYNSYRLRQKYIIPLIVAMEKFYKEVIQNEGKRNTGVRKAFRARSV